MFRTFFNGTLSAKRKEEIKFCLLMFKTILYESNLNVYTYSLVI